MLPTRIPATFVPTKGSGKLAAGAPGEEADPGDPPPAVTDDALGGGASPRDTLRHAAAPPG